MPGATRGLIVGGQLSGVNCRGSIVGGQLSGVNCRGSIVGGQLSGVIVGARGGQLSPSSWVLYHRAARIAVFYI